MGDSHDEDRKRKEVLSASLKGRWTVETTHQDDILILEKDHSRWVSSGPFFLYFSYTDIFKSTSCIFLWPIEAYDKFAQGDAQLFVAHALLLLKSWGDNECNRTGIIPVLTTTVSFFLTNAMKSSMCVCVYLGVFSRLCFKLLMHFETVKTKWCHKMPWWQRIIWYHKTEWVYIVG